MLMIRFQRIGRTNDPAFRIVVLEKERAAKAGNIVEQLGTYNPRSKALTLNEERVKHWISMGAQPTDSIRNLLISKKVIEGKKVNALPKKTPQVAPTSEVGVPPASVGNEEAMKAAAEAQKKAVDDAAAAKAAEEAAAAAPAEVAAPELPTEAEVIAEADAEVGSPTPEDVGAEAEVVAEAEPASEEVPAVAAEEAPAEVAVEEAPAEPAA